MPRPFVSVLIDTYNHERFIEQAIVSVLEQDFPASDREIIVVDDGSTDRTPEILRKFESQVRVLRKANGGQASAFNAGLPECGGEIVAFLDGDDWWAKEKLKRVAESMAAEQSVGIVGHGIVNVHFDKGEQCEILREGFQFQANTLEGAQLFRRRGAFLGTSRMTLRADLLRRIGRVPEAIVIQADEYLYTLAAVLSGVRILPEALTYYRLHENNSFQLASHDPEKLRRKQRALATLATTLSQELAQLGIEKQVRRAVIEYTELCAAQLRLTLDGGRPWETFQTEWRLNSIVHPDVAFPQRTFKLLVLLGALVTSPRTFYGAQRKLSQNRVYQRLRQRWLPFPQMRHIQTDWRAKP